jgi:hypothetical protein
MELLLIPVLLVTGAALLHIGINGAPPVPHFATMRPGMTFSSLRGATAARTTPAHRVDLLNPDLEPEDVEIEAEELVETLELSDVLLAELLSEMMMFRKELAELRAQVASATAAAESMRAPEPVRVRKASPRSGRAVKATA